jgi:hypothetical protein
MSSPRPYRASSRSYPTQSEHWIYYSTQLRNSTIIVRFLLLGERVEGYTILHARLSQWEGAFQPLLDRAKDVMSSDPEAAMPGLILSVYHRVALIIVSTCLPSSLESSSGICSGPPSEMTSDSLLPHFKYIASLSNTLLSLLPSTEPSTSCPSTLPRPKFTFEVGLLPPLYIVGSKCREPATRREVIERLGRCPGQKGLWDPIGGGTNL